MDVGNLDQILAFIVDYPVLWPLYLFGLFLLVRPHLHELFLEGSTLSRYDENGNVVEELRIRQPNTPNEPHSGHSDLTPRQAWQDGCLDNVSTAYRQYAEEVSGDQFSLQFRHDNEQPGEWSLKPDPLPALSYVQERTDILNNERLLAAAATPVKMSYVLTDRSFAFFGLDKGFLSNNYESGILPISAIESILHQKKWTGLVNMNIRLVNGTELVLKDMPDTLPAEYIDQAFQEKQEKGQQS